MRPFVSFFTFFSFFSAAALVAARTEIISSLDKQISYQGEFWRKIDAPGGGFMYLRRGRGGSATLTVPNAMQIGVTVSVQTPGDRVRIVLDNTEHFVTPTSVMAPAWNSSILDPSIPHDLTIVKVNSGEEYMGFYSLLVTHPDSPEDTTGAASTVLRQSTSSGTSSLPNTSSGTLSTPNASESSSPLSVQESNTEPVLSGAKLAGVIVGGITVLALIIGVILYRRWMVSKRKAASTAYWDYITARAQQPPGSPSPPTPPDGRPDIAEVREMP